MKQVQAPHLSDPQERDTFYTSFAFLSVAGAMFYVRRPGYSTPELGPSATAAPPQCWEAGLSRRWSGLGWLVARISPRH
ncbi:hypothetical protein SBA7_830012 [Candidatus Sulfotelmatobacter sp. SbA7]|nr:hypothetical protein SBA7_830012 [Candidatus Sulfotelmatobacter sp. SbA7]